MPALRHTAREQRLLARANHHFGLVRREELIAAGVDRNAIHLRLKAGRLTLLHRGVYAWGHTALQDRGRWLAALWACGPDAVLSHTSASAYHGWTTEDPGAPVHVTTTRAVRSRDGIVVHRVRTLDRRDVHRAGVFAVTTMPRTLVDLADVIDWPAYRTVADGQYSLRVDKIREAPARAPFRRGAPLVTRLIEADDAHTKSEFERRFLRFVAAHDLPRPSGLNVKVAGQQADCVYEQQKLVVELDGRAFHRRRSQMRADRLRDTKYQLAGYRVLRLMWDDLHPAEGPQHAANLRALLALGG